MFFYKRKKKVISIDGILDDISIKKLEDTLESLVDVSKVKVDLKKKQVIVFYDNIVDDILLQNTIEKLGYIITGIKENS